jgi:hypothetical protein
MFHTSNNHMAKTTEKNGRWRLGMLQLIGVNNKVIDRFMGFKKTAKQT